jgi:hypothetical protein
MVPGPQVISDQDESISQSFMSLKNKSLPSLGNIHSDMNRLGTYMAMAFLHYGPC